MQRIRVQTVARFHLGALLLVAGLNGCRPSPTWPPPGEPPQDVDGEGCPALDPSIRLSPIGPEAKALAYWLERAEEVDAVVLAPQAIRASNAALAVREDLQPSRRLNEAPNLEALRTEASERAGIYARRLSDQTLWTRQGDAPPPEPGDAVEFGLDEVEVRVALETTLLRCFAYPEALYEHPADLRFDRNACSAVHPQEPVRLLARWANGLWLAESQHAMGWIDANAPLSPPVEGRVRNAFVRGPSARVEPQSLRGPDAKAIDMDGVSILPLAGPDSVYFASEKGFHRSRPMKAKLRPIPRALTRRSLLTEAFSLLGKPYGYGGANGGLDCSRFIVELFGRFGLDLPRHSSDQAAAGTFTVDVRATDERTRAHIIDAAHERGIVLLHLPGHIMLYLGRGPNRAQMAIHALGEYAEPCPSRPDVDTIRRVEQVVVSDLDLGRGSSRASFIERLTDITVIGGTPGMALAGIARIRAAAPLNEGAEGKTCRDEGEPSLFVSPEAPTAGHPLRLIAVGVEDFRPAAVTLLAPSGQRHTPKPVMTGGPPYGLIAQIGRPEAGRWQAIVSDGGSLHACRFITVSAEEANAPLLGAPFAEGVWPIRRRWNRATESLYAVFIERLFDYPLSTDEPTWKSLQPILRDSSRNILSDHLRPKDDHDLELLADCADLPYVLRAYFAWKMRLPFAYRSCHRGRHGAPPRCPKEGGDNLQPPRRSDEVKAFERFANRQVRNTVHSSSARTHPEDEETDFYPVPLRRPALFPGTLFADPYGHLLVLVDWTPQGLDSYGVLLAADAQPDGTIGRRRFWRGSFLFHPETRAGGAGFKAYRPAVLTGVSRGQPVIERTGNRALEDHERAPYSLEQYVGSAEDFYRRMERLINPRPLDPLKRQIALVDAFEAQVSRRAVSIANGEAFMAQRAFRSIDMPSGASIFLTTGAWEDYSTPSRDLRLLIALDTTVEFPDRVEANPERFGLSRASVRADLTELRTALRSTLESRTITYVRSDGTKATLTLAQIVDRRKLLEMAYNPNDCVEVRWLAPAGSDERATCRRRAPKSQRLRMEAYRVWFSTRRRPPN